MSGSVTRRVAAHGPAPSPRAASSRERSRPVSTAATERTVYGSVTTTCPSRSRQKDGSVRNRLKNCRSAIPVTSPDAHATSHSRQLSPPQRNDLDTLPLPCPSGQLTDNARHLVRA